MGGALVTAGALRGVAVSGGGVSDGGGTGVSVGGSGVTVGGTGVRVGTGEYVGDGTWVTVAVGGGVNVSDGVMVAGGVGLGRAARAVPVSSSSLSVSVLVLSDRMMPNVRASASVPITAMATINSLLRSRRRSIRAVPPLAACAAARAG